jgi:hypothetical protein
MDYPLIKIGTALVRGGVLLAGPAYAVSPLALNGAPSLLVLAGAGDVENEEVWRDLRPDITPPEAAVGKEGEAPPATQPEKPKEEGKGEIEEKEMKEDGLDVPE